MASAVEATVESCAAEASTLGFTCTWHDRSTGAPAAHAGSRASLTLRLAHESAADAVNVDFLPVLDRVQIFAECGARRARCDVEAGAAGAGRRFAVHVLQPLVTGGVADETLLGLPESVRRVIYELLPAPAVGLVAEAAKPLREEASSDAVWMRLLRRDADALLVSPQDLPTNRPRLGVYDEDHSRWGIVSLWQREQEAWERFNDDQGLDWALPDWYRNAGPRYLLAGPRGPRW